MSSDSLSMTAPDQRAVVGNRESGWRWLYKLGGAAAFISLLVIPITIIVYFVWPPPDTVIGHFKAFQSNWLVGFLGMDLLYLLGNILLIPTWLALYVALRRANESLTAVALTLGLIAIVALIASRPIIEMQALSHQYTAAVTEAQQAIYVAAGEALLAIYQGTAFNAHYFLGTIGLLIFSWVMLQSDLFSKKVAYLGIATNVITLGYYLPVIGIYVSIFSVLFYWVWIYMVARRFWQLGRV